MATVKVSFGAVFNIGGTSVFGKEPRAVQTITSSGASQQSTAAATAGEFVTITSSGGAVHVSVGQNPTASASAGYLIQDGGEKTIGPCNAGDEVAILDA